MLRHYLRPHRGRVALLFLLLGGSITLQLLGPQLLGRFVDTAAAGEDGSPNRLYTIAAPVSYTHLDVYKRQGLGRVGSDAVRLGVVAVNDE